MDNLSEKAKKGLQKSVEFLRSRAQETLELHKVSTHVKELQKRHEECIRDMGYRVYTMMRKGEIDQRALRERYVEALELEKAIERGIRDQENIRDQYRADLKIFLPKEAPPAVYCTFCQAPIASDAPQCLECGAPVPGRSE